MKALDNGALIALGLVGVVAAAGLMGEPRGRGSADRMIWVWGIFADGWLQLGPFWTEAEARRFLASHTSTFKPGATVEEYETEDHDG